MYRKATKPPSTRQVVLRRATRFERFASPVLSTVRAAMTFGLVAAGEPALGAVAACPGFIGLRMAAATVLAWWREQTITLIADRDASELRCVDALHRVRVKTQCFPLEGILTIRMAPVDPNVDEGKPYAVRCMDGSVGGANLARFDDQAEVDEAAARALELLAWLGDETAGVVGQTVPNQARPASDDGPGR